MFSNKSPSSPVPLFPVAEFQYRRIGVELPASEPEMPNEEDLICNEDQILRNLALERAAGAAEAEERLRKEYEQRSCSEKSKVSRALEEFQKERKQYFERVENEVVQLALAIAAKILHREAQVDPLLVATLVKIALDQLKEGSSAKLRVRSETLVHWHNYFATNASKVDVEICVDSELDEGDCVLETQLGSVNFSLAAQLKEVEQGFCDVLAQRPPS